MPDNHYVNSKLAEIYDLDSGWSIDRDFYLSLAGSQRQTILDLGCGTELLCNAYAAKNHDVTGVGPTPAMLELGRRKPHGNKIEWVQSFAQTYQSDKLFDLIIMTGHAFQVLLEDVDVLKIFSTMGRHLKRGGIDELLTASGLCIDKVMGDWDGTQFNERSSQEMIFIVRAAT
jgi:2-polyprenyl-3-methyl-5-hydroxy-6-metoxy-1,4-benzoquinol methylase